jgi:hypothetical protein
MGKGRTTMLNDGDRANTATKESNVAQQQLGPSNDASSETIQTRAYELYCARGCEHGHDVEDWLEAEREYRLGSE